MTTKGVHTIDHVLREWEGRPPVTGKFVTSGGEAHKIVSTLAVTSRAEGYGTSGARLHQIVMFFMGLNIRTKFQVAVFSVVQGIAGHKCKRAQSVRNPIPGREHVEPEHGRRDHFLEHQNWEAAKGNQVVQASRTFLYHPDEMFDLRDMLVIQTNINPVPDLARELRTGSNSPSA
jgi:hypothetical protein